MAIVCAVMMLVTCVVIGFLIFLIQIKIKNGRK